MKYLTKILVLLFTCSTFSSVLSQDHFDEKFNIDLKDSTLIKIPKKIYIKEYNEFLEMELGQPNIDQLRAKYSFINLHTTCVSTDTIQQWGNDRIFKRWEVFDSSKKERPMLASQDQEVIIDSAPPIPVCTDIRVNLEDGKAILKASELDAGSHDAESGEVTMTVKKFLYYDGEKNVYGKESQEIIYERDKFKPYKSERLAITATDEAGNYQDCVFNVEIFDQGIEPTLVTGDAYEIDFTYVNTIPVKVEELVFTKYTPYEQELTLSFYPDRVVDEIVYNKVDSKKTKDHLLDVLKVYAIDEHGNQTSQDVKIYVRSYDERYQELRDSFSLTRLPTIENQGNAKITWRPNKELKANTSMDMYVNQYTAQLYWKTDNAVQIYIFDESGKLVPIESENSKGFTITEFDTHPKGVYDLRNQNGAYLGNIVKI